MGLAFQAMELARTLHKDQRRKYNGTPYFDHLAEVAGIVSTVADDFGEHPSCDEMLAVAWLHDCMEDQSIVPGALGPRFGATVNAGVRLLSDLEVGSRAERKQASRCRLAAAPGWVQTIKLADLISNTSSIRLCAPDYAGTYLREKRELLAVMNRGHAGLYAIARELAGS